MYVLSWRTVSVPIRVLLLCLLPHYFATREINTKISLSWALKQLVTWLYTLSSTYCVQMWKQIVKNISTWWTWFLEHVILAHVHCKSQQGKWRIVNKSVSKQTRSSVVIKSIVTEFVQAQQVRLGSGEHNYSECVGTLEHRAVISKLSGGIWYGHRLTG